MYVHMYIRCYDILYIHIYCMYMCYIVSLQKCCRLQIAVRKLCTTIQDILYVICSTYAGTYCRIQTICTYVHTYVHAYVPRGSGALQLLF